MTGRREQILTTAAELFAERGFHGVSVAELGAACGISGPALYKHFPSKDAMLAEMLVDISEELLRVGRSRSAAATDASDAVRALVAWHVDFALGHKPLIVVQDRDWSSLPDAARERVRSLQRRYVDLWASRLRQVHPDLTAERARAMAHAAFGLINSTPHSATLPEPEMRAMLEQMALGALGLRPADVSESSSDQGSLARVTGMSHARFKDLCLDADDPPALGAFWAGALGLDLHLDDDGDAHLTGPTPAHTIWVNKVPEPKTVKHRIHLDVNVGAVEDLTRLGATVLDDRFEWTVMADPEGGEFCAFVRADQITQRLYEIGVDTGDSAEDSHRITAWWAGVLGGRMVDDDRGFSWLEEIPGTPFASVDFVPVPEAKTVKNRVHLDVTTGDLGALVAAGAVVLRAQDDEIGWTVLADPDGNEFCAFVDPAGSLS